MHGIGTKKTLTLYLSANLKTLSATQATAYDKRIRIGKEVAERFRNLISGHIPECVRIIMVVDLTTPSPSRVVQTEVSSYNAVVFACNHFGVRVPTTAS
jgi:hypothetical protein